jgi:hypothetical protein
VRPVPDGESAFDLAVPIASGESVDLMLFARLHDERLKYFPFEPGKATDAPNVPSHDLKLTDPRNFEYASHIRMAGRSWSFQRK